MFAFLKSEVAEAMAVAGCIAMAGADTYHVVDGFAGEEPEDGVEVDLDTVPDDAEEAP